MLDVGSQLGFRLTEEQSLLQFLVSVPMPRELTPRLQKYLEFIREYIARNRSAPMLKEIAQHFDVSSPVAIKALKTLQEKGYLYFGRSKTLGFYIRLPEWHTSGQQMVEVSQMGLVDQYGMLYEFPTHMAHFPMLRLNSQNGKLLVLRMAADIPQANLLGRDQLICERGMTPNVDDICVAMIGPEKYCLVSILDVFPRDDEVDETMIYDASAETWTNAQPDDSPPGRITHGLAFDSANEVVDLFGGIIPEGGQLGDTWTYSYEDNEWTDMSGEPTNTGTTSTSGTTTGTPPPEGMNLDILVLLITPGVLVVIILAANMVRVARNERLQIAES